MNDLVNPYVINKRSCGTESKAFAKSRKSHLLNTDHPDFWPTDTQMQKVGIHKNDLNKNHADEEIIYQIVKKCCIFVDIIFSIHLTARLVRLIGLSIIRW